MTGGGRNRLAALFVVAVGLCWPKTGSARVKQAIDSAVRSLPVSKGS